MNKNDKNKQANTSDNIDGFEEFINYLNDNKNINDTIDTKTKRVEVKDKYGYDYTRIDSDKFVSKEEIEHDKKLFDVQKVVAIKADEKEQEEENKKKTKPNKKDSKTPRKIMEHPKVEVEVELEKTKRNDNIIKPNNKSFKNEGLAFPKPKKHIFISKIRNNNDSNTAQKTVRKNKKNKKIIFNNKLIDFKNNNIFKIRANYFDNKTSSNQDDKIEQVKDKKNTDSITRTTKEIKTNKTKKSPLIYISKKGYTEKSSKKVIDTKIDKRIEDVDTEKTPKNKIDKKHKFNNKVNHKKNKSVDKYKRDNKKSKVGKSLASVGLIFIVISVVIGIITISPKIINKMPNANNSTNLGGKEIASYFITYPNEEKGNIQLLDLEGNKLHSIDFTDSIIRKDVNNSKIYLYNNIEKTINTVIYNEISNDLTLEEITKIEIEENITDMIVGSNIITLLSTNKAYVISLENKILLKELDINSILSREFLKCENISEAISFDNSLFFINNSKIFKLDLINENLESMDFMKDNVKIFVHDGKIVLHNIFGHLNKENNIFIINPDNFLVESNITTRSENTKIIENSEHIKNFIVLESKTSDFKNIKTMYFLEEGKKNTIKNISNEHFYSIENEIYSKGYIYAINGKGTSRYFINAYDISNSKKTTILSDNCNFLPIYK